MRPVATASTASIEPAAGQAPAVRRFTSLPPRNPLVPGMLSVALHVALAVGLLHALDLQFYARADSGREPGDPVMLSDWVRDSSIHEVARSDMDSTRLVTRDAHAQPPRIVVDRVPVPDAGDVAPAEIESPESLDALTLAAEADEVGSLDLQPMLTVPVDLEPSLAGAIPLRRSREVEPDLQAELMQRVTKAAPALIKAGRTELNWEQDGQPYRAVLSREPGADAMDLERVRVDITTESPSGTSLQTRLTLKRLAYSHFTQIVDQWDPMVELHDDEIIGRFHSNSSFLVSADREAAPRISGTASTTAGGLDRGPEQRTREPRIEAFEGGFETGARRIELPRRAPQPEPAAADPDAYVRRFDYDTRLTFHRDGSYTWEAVGTGVSAQESYPLDRPAFLVGAPGVMLRVKGTISGTVLVYANWAIVVEGDLRYADDPRVSPDSADYLGLVSNNYVQIARPEMTGPGDLQIDAAIFARKEFVVRDIDAARAGTLSIYGSLTSGTMSATEPRYATRIEFDPRLARVRLPSFPSTDRYELDQWNAEWTEVAAVDAGADETPAGVVTATVPQDSSRETATWRRPPP